MILRREQEYIERTYSLWQRAMAVISLVHALDYLDQGPLQFSIDIIQARSILVDGIENALDHRATGWEFRTLRHSRMAKQDPQNYPQVKNEDRRCQECGAVDPTPFSRCPHTTTGGASCS